MERDYKYVIQDSSEVDIYYFKIGNKPITTLIFNQDYRPEYKNKGPFSYSKDYKDECNYSSLTSKSKVVPLDLFPLAMGMSEDNFKSSWFLKYYTGEGGYGDTFDLSMVELCPQKYQDLVNAYKNVNLFDYSQSFVLFKCGSPDYIKNVFESSTKEFDDIVNNIKKDFRHVKTKVSDIKHISIKMNQNSCLILEHLLTLNENYLS